MFDQLTAIIWVGVAPAGVTGEDSLVQSDRQAVSAPETLKSKWGDGGESGREGERYPPEVTEQVSGKARDR